ncbi:hypothetical protein EK904_007111 [Melospiza melodia maxima]|nr:hypothetical protein EK904_007111 [Melospiza melodia maxima]
MLLTPSPPWPLALIRVRFKSSTIGAPVTLSSHWGTEDTFDRLLCFSRVGSDPLHSSQIANLESLWCYDIGPARVLHQKCEFFPGNSIEPTPFHFRHPRPEVRESKRFAAAILTMTVMDLNHCSSNNGAKAWVQRPKGPRNPAEGTAVGKDNTV